jgi:hypothetical protein
LADKAIDVYLNDHLAGAMFGTELAAHVQAQNEGTPLGEVMASLTAQIEEDRQTLADLMAAMDTSENPLKEVATWVAEKASQAKFTGLTSGNHELGTMMALEALLLGVRGKAYLWRTLKAVAERYPEVAWPDFELLINRAEAQIVELEREHAQARMRALTGP